MNLGQLSWVFEENTLDVARGSRCSSDPFSRRDVVEVVAVLAHYAEQDGREQRLALLRLRDGRFALARYQFTPPAEPGALSTLVSDSLQRLVEQGLEAQEQRRLLRVDAQQLRLSQRVDETARLLREGEAGAARSLMLDLLVELLHGADDPSARSYGSRPRLAPAASVEALSIPVDQAARALRQGNTRMARGLMLDALVQLADLLELPDHQRVDWERQTPSSRAPALADAFFDPAAPASLVRHGCRALLDPEARERDRSFGEIKNPYLIDHRTGSAERGGLLCPIVFGPLQQHRCACGKYRSAEHDGTVCEKCGVLCGSPSTRDWRFGHVAVPGIVHPAFEARIAELLGWTAEDVRDVSRGDAWVDGSEVRRPVSRARRLDGTTARRTDDLSASGVAAIGGALERAGASSRELLLEIVPVLPPGDRPDVQRAGKALDHIGLPLTSRVTMAYQRLVEHAHTQRRLIELDAPQIIIRSEGCAVQRCLHLLLREVEARCSDSVAVDGWENSGTAPRQLLLTASEQPTESESSAIDLETAGDGLRPPASALWVDEHHLLVNHHERLLVVDPSSRSISRSLRCGWLTPVLTDGRLVVLKICRVDNDWLEEEAWAGVRVLDLKSWRWLEQYPDHLTAVSCDEEMGDYQDTVIVDRRSGRARAFPRELALLCFSRDGRFLWLHDLDQPGIVVETRSAAIELLTDVLDLDRTSGPVLTVDGTLVDPQAFDEDDVVYDEDWEYPVASLCLAPDDEWRVLSPDGIVGGLVQTYFSLGFRPRAAAFSPDGTHLAVCIDEALWIIEVDERPRVERIELVHQ